MSCTLTQVGVGLHLRVHLGVAGAGRGARLGLGLLDRRRVGVLEHVRSDHRAREHHGRERHEHRREGDEQRPHQQERGGCLAEVDTREVVRIDPAELGHHAGHDVTTDVRLTLAMETAIGKGSDPRGFPGAPHIYDVASTMKTVDGVPETSRDFVDDRPARIHSSRRLHHAASDAVHCNTGAHRTTGDKRTVVAGWIRRRRAASRKNASEAQIFRQEIPSDVSTPDCLPVERNAKYTKCTTLCV